MYVRCVIVVAAVLTASAVSMSWNDGASASIGVPVTVEEAKSFRGGCMNVSMADCDDGNVNQGCSIGYKVVSGNNSGKPEGDIKCAASCGSFFSDYKDCPGSY